MIKIYPITKAHPEDYEKWLEKFETEGWHLNKLSLGGWLHHFSKGKSVKYRYCYDFQRKMKMDYEQIFKDLGWELVYCFAGAYIWRKEYSDIYPEAFNDYESIIARNNRFVLLLTPLLIVYPATTPSLIHNFDLRAPMSVGAFIIETIFYIAIIPVFFRLLYTNRKMKKRIKR